MQLTSPVFENGDPLPRKYTCDGQDISPPLAWSDVPAGTKSVALMLEDPDAPGGTFTHWVAFNLDAHLNEIKEAIPARPSIDGGGSQGKNDAGRMGYYGPCPPAGKVHHYKFTLIALDSNIDLHPGASKRQVIAAMENHVLATTSLIGTYIRG